MIEIAVGLIALSFVAVAIYLVVFLKKLGNLTDEAQQTLKVLTSDVNVTLYQTNELLAKTNILVEDCQEKFDTLDPLFTAVADLSESVSDLNSSAREWTGKAKKAGKRTAKAGSVLSTLSIFSSIFGKKGAS